MRITSLVSVIEAPPSSGGMFLFHVLTASVRTRNKTDFDTPVDCPALWRVAGRRRLALAQVLYGKTGVAGGRWPVNKHAAAITADAFFIAFGGTYIRPRDQPARFCPDTTSPTSTFVEPSFRRACPTSNSEGHTVKTHGLNLKRSRHLHFLFRRTPVANGA